MSETKQLREAHVFHRGMAVIIAWLARRDHSLAEYAMKENGITIADLREAKVDKFDMDPIREAVKP